ncbi:NADH-quinone oxidoreductase subunit J [candidate division KSB1 bacterium]|nr:NADH-quinone oxidoreductase subunit J [candidate division KSB1 bacterium]
MISFFFFFFSVIVIASAIVMILHKNPVYSALFLIITFFGIAGFYFLLEAQFLAIVHIIVYAGAIMVLFLFVIMLLNLRQEARMPIGKPFQVLFGSVLSVLFLSQIFLIIYKGSVTGKIGNFPPEKINELGSVEVLGGKLFTDYLFPFEAASILLLIGIVGAIVLGSKHLPKEE